ncbi:ATP-binding protein [Allokutzneria oryzae]|uniref:ATP-binding protein n=1 Tax=Allokutzneria oryzae TaxID=1378989 RepID=A0ABV5ZT99_9PSEU
MTDPTLPGRFSLDLSGHAVPPLRALRQRVRAALAGESDACLHAAELLATELVSNAYDHGGPPRRFSLRRFTEQRLVRIEVDDGDTVGVPHPGGSRLGGNRGRGLILIDRLARHWGVITRAHSKTVWAELSCDVR